MSFRLCSPHAVGFALLGLAVCGNAVAQSYTFVAKGTTATHETAGAMSPGAPAGASSGDLLLICTRHRSNAQTLTITGWTELATKTDAGGSIKVFGRIKDGTGDDTPTVDWAGSSHTAVWIEAYTGDVFSGGLGSIVANSNTSGANATGITLPTLTITTDNTMVYACAGKHTTAGDATDVTVTPEFTERGEFLGGANRQHLASGSWQQTTATSYDGDDWAVNGTSENVSSNGIVIALQSDDLVAPSFSVAPTVSAQDSNDYTLSYTPSQATTFYAVACKKDQTAPTVAQVKAGDCTGDVDAVAAVSEAVTGADTTVLGGALTFPVHDIYAALSDAGGDSSLATLADECLDAPSGKQIINCPTGLTSIGSGSPIEALNTAITPDIATGDIPICDALTDPGAFALTVSVAGQFSYSGDESRQYANCTFYDLSVGAIHADDLDWWVNNQEPVPPLPPGSVRFYAPLNEAMTPASVSLCTDPEDDDITVEEVDPLPTGLEIVFDAGDDRYELQGTLTEDEDAFLDLTWRCCDITGACVDWD